MFLFSLVVVIVVVVLTQHLAADHDVMLLLAVSGRESIVLQNGE